MSSARSLSRAARPLLTASTAPSPSSSTLRPIHSHHHASTSAAVASSSSSSSAPIHTSASRSAPPPAAASVVPSSLDTAAAGAAPPPPQRREPHAPHTHLPRLARKDAALFAALRPPPLSALAALAARLGLLPSSLDAQSRQRRIQLVHQACTHPSFRNLVQRAVHEHPGSQFDLDAAGLVRNRAADRSFDALQFLPQNLARTDAEAAELASSSHAALATVGNSLLGMLASESLHLRYPNLPTRVLKAAVAAYVGPSTLANVGNELGLGGQGVLRWDRQARVAATRSSSSAATAADKQAGSASGSSSKASTKALLSKDVTADAMRALVAVMFQELGLSTTRNFITTHLLSRHLDLSSLLKFADPKRALSSTCAKYGRERPQSRLIAESGRLSINPLFVVGVYSGSQKLGEGSGSAIRMAEYRAAEDALRRLYLASHPVEEGEMPSVTLDAVYPASGTVAGAEAHGQKEEQQTVAYTPLPLGACEVLEVAGKA